MRIRILATTALLAALSLASHAQTNASCTFNLFQLNPSNALNPSTYATGVTDKGTVVGAADFQSGAQQGFIRYSTGTVAYYSAPNAAATYFTDRNVNAISIGIYSTKDNQTIAKGFMLNGKVFTPIADPKSPGATYVQSINKWNTIVGWYPSGQNEYGFRRNSNGSFVALNYPGATITAPMAINDNGMIVGTYWNQNQYTGGGFIYYNGKWASLNYPGRLSGTTQLLGVSDAGLITGSNNQNDPQTSFIYENGAFKVVSVPNSFSTQVEGISPDGLITGYVFFNGSSSSQHGFTARCK
jgi:hypothetical protein